MAIWWDMHLLAGGTDQLLGLATLCSLAAFWQTRSNSFAEARSAVVTDAEVKRTEPSAMEAKVMARRTCIVDCFGEERSEIMLSS